MKDKLNGYKTAVFGAIVGVLTTLALLAPKILVHENDIQRHGAEIMSQETTINVMLQTMVTRDELSTQLATLKADLIRELGR